MQTSPPREGVGAAEGGSAPREGGRPGQPGTPPPPLHTKGPGDPASCRRCRAGPGLWAPLQSQPPRGGSQGRGCRGRCPACTGRRGAKEGRGEWGPRYPPGRPPPPCTSSPPSPDAAFPLRDRRGFTPAAPRLPKAPLTLAVRTRPAASVTPRPRPSAGCLVSPLPQRRCSHGGKGRGPSGGGGGRRNSWRTHLFF